MVEQFQFFLDRANLEFDKDLELKVIQLLRANKKTIAVAESMTGGLLSEKLTRLPGSSEYFIGGAVSYHVRAKVILTGIEPKVIAKYGLVSEETAAGLAGGIRKKLHADLGLGITGVAGPESHGGAEVGNVYIALADQEKERVQHFVLEGSREEIREKAALVALKMITLYFEH
jgi:nicotinamide-nucleotide amidase